MKRFIFFTSFFVFSLPIFAQQSKIDSLLTLLKKDKEDTNKVNHLNNLSREYISIGSYDSSSVFVNTALKLSQQLSPPYKKGIINAYNNLGIVYWCQGNYPKSLNYYLKALKMAEELGDKNGIARHFANIGLVYWQQGDYPKALDYYFKALKMGEEIGYKQIQANTLGNIGIIYYEQKDYPKAFDYYLKGLKMHEEIGDKKKIAEDLGNIGLIYVEEKDYPKALDYYFQALKIAEELGDKRGATINLGNIGALYLSIKKYSEAEKYLLYALKGAKEITDLNDERIFEEAITDLYEKTGKEKLALEHYKKSMELKDTIFSQEEKKQLVRKEMSYEFDKKEAATKAEADKQMAVAAAESKKQKIIIWSVVGGLLLVVVFAGFIFRSLRVTRKQKQIIEIKSRETEQQKLIIEEKNKDITDSINYAKRIQQAKLPNKEEIYSSFPQSFVLFKPKDIVSGDFYFFHKNEQLVFIAAADCTGHGVPGAFMSMIGSEKLDDAVSETTDTSEILKLLNKGIKTSLRQSDSDESTRDGMDIALCSVDTENRIVKYAGANRPIWLIRNGQTMIEEIKATKKAIGGFTEDNQHFDTHEIKLQQGDTFYISTDGYADTFSGQGHKKLTTKKFKEILLDMQDKTMKEQEEHLEIFIENWKAGTEQVDDILVIGIRL